MNNMNENKQNETSGPVFNKESLRYVKEDLREALEKVSSVREQIEDKEMNTWLAIAEDQIVDTLNEIEDREDKVEGLIKSIAS